jgi:hypothetical protein
LESKDLSSKPSEQADFQVPDFGALNPGLLESGKTYYCHAYRMSDEVAKAVTEHTSFTACFDSPNMRTATMDLWKNQGRVVIEIERNARPKEISVRYPKDRWNVLEAQAIGAEGVKPSIKTEYGALVLGPKVFAGIAESLRISADLMQQILLRLNFKEKTFSIIAPESLSAQLPADKTASSVVPACPGGGVAQGAAAPQTQFAASTSEEEPAADSAPETGTETETEPDQPPETGQAKTESKTRDSDAPPETASKSKVPRAVSSQRSDMDQQQKYATYSRSEVDQLLKQQAEQLAAALGTKISQQQRAFQEAMDKQEKSFSRISDAFATKLDSARIQIENTAKGTSEETHKELDEFKKQLVKELEMYRAQINKAATRETAKPAAAPAQAAAPKAERVPSPVQAGAPARDQVLTGLLVAALVAAMVNFVTIMLSIGDVKQYLVDIDAKLSKMAPTAPK